MVQSIGLYFLYRILAKMAHNNYGEYTMKASKASKVRKDFVIDNTDLTKRQEVLDANLDFMRVKIREIFNKDGYHAPMAFFFDIRGNFLNVLLLTDFLSDKDGLAEVLKNTCSNPMVGGIVMVLEAWAYYAKKGVKNDPLMDKIAKGESRISELGDGEKREIVSITMEDIDDRSIMVTYPIDHSKGKPTISRGKKLVGKVHKDGNARFCNFFGTPAERAQRATKIIASLMKLVNSASPNSQN